MKLLRLPLILLIALILLILLSGCSGLRDTALPTPLPAEYLPTAIALTLQAGAAASPTPAPTLIPAGYLPTAIAMTVQAAEAGETTPLPLAVSPKGGKNEAASVPSLSPTPTPIPLPTRKAIVITPPLPPTHTPPAPVPDAPIQIYRLGDLSRVVSPIQVSGFIRKGFLGTIIVELRGEDGRVLVRQVKAFEQGPESYTNFTFNLEFGITAAAEVGRLIISVSDDEGKVNALNSVDLVLLSNGQNDLNPATGLLEKIVVQQPAPKALIQGGTVWVSGIARPSTNRPFMAQLVSEDGRVVGQRLVGVSINPDGGYNGFSAEVPYTVKALTPVRLVVYEDGGEISEIRYLTSLELMLGP